METSISLAEIFPFLHRHDLMDEMLANATIMVAEPGEVIAREGQYLKVLPLVISGLLRVQQQSDGREILLYYVQPGATCIMSLNSCFFNLRSQSHAIAETRTELLCIPTRFIREWQRKYDQWNDFVIKTFQSRYTELLDLFNAVVFTNIDTRIEAYLNDCASRQNAQIVPITHLALANALGTTRVVVSRILKRFEQEGRIQLSHNKIRVINL